MIDKADIQARTVRLLGQESVDRLAATRVILFGVGGVGSWCAEALIRAGIGHLTMVDFDTISVSNINRQLPATTETVGQVKVEVLRDRLLTINPYADIRAVRALYTAETSPQFALQDYDYVVDAIDSLRDKAELILEVTHLRGVKLFSSMGAALKMDVSRIRVDEFWHVTGDPLARALRERFKREKRMPGRKFRCVYSDELLRNRQDTTESLSNHDDSPIHKPQTNGSMAHITMQFGAMLAGLVITDASCKEE